ncbi:hypothetical protein AOQ84DRAFT_390079 [Glonium stellatum]|uniref:Uncharacterized protein n=1 Tax=Glonium stellatum TaxID=574774 RepID=A0A8E2JR61_9PEZI|nr:hypothetical protein AOQ84DRAFT_390079 [Glonium stellatum]
MTKYDYRMLKREAKSRRISVNPKKYSPVNSDNVSIQHKEMFAVIQSLGRTEFDKYRFSPTIETPDKPWQQLNKILASKLVHLAAKCRKENRNEAGWRNEVEFRIFERFDIEVACKRCRKRLWRSEVEASESSSNSSTSSLSRRQKYRQPCRCNPMSRLDDCMDAGLSDVFSSRLQETVCQSERADSQLLDPKKQPDRLHGLQRTQVFDQLLQAPYAHDDNRQHSSRMVEDVVKVSVNPDNRGDLI